MMHCYSCNIKFLFDQYIVILRNNTVFFFVFIILFTLCYSSPSHSEKIHLEAVFSKASQPTDIKFIPKTTSQAFIAEKTGKVLFVNFDTQTHYVVANVKVRTVSEMGLLGLAFHPEYPKVNSIFVNYTPQGGEYRSRVSSFTVDINNNQYALSNEQIIIEVNQPYANHNGGQIAFGHDGYLYIGLGDGGSSNDPLEHGQNLTSLLGAMLRIDVNVPTVGKTSNITTPYLIPSDNPFLKRLNVRPEIYAYGLRNPWRFSFAPDGKLIVADVGQYQYEEVSVIEKGQNYGWNIMEATHCFRPKIGCNQKGLTLPKVEYNHEQGSSIIGGYVYTGSLSPILANKYLYADYVSGAIWAVNYPDFTNPSKIVDSHYHFSTFGQNNNGEVYIADIATGTIYLITQSK